MIRLFTLFLIPVCGFSQMKWQNADERFGPLPMATHIFYSNDSIDGKPNIAYYISIPLRNKDLVLTDQVGNGKRLTPTQYYEQEGKPFLVVNCTFFEFVHNNNLNLVMQDGAIKAFGQPSVPARGKDTFTYNHPFSSAIGISKNRKADVAWVYTDSSLPNVYASQSAIGNVRDSFLRHDLVTAKRSGNLKKWKMQTAVGGGPVLLQNGEIHITNNEELKFAGKAINDKHPRTCMGYTNDGQLIIMVIEGRFPGKAEGATLEQEAKMLKDIGCWEALNLDGGGSSCMLVNGKQTITPSDKEGQRPVPAVFIVKERQRK